MQPQGHGRWTVCSLTHARALLLCIIEFDGHSADRPCKYSNVWCKLLIPSDVQLEYLAQPDRRTLLASLRTFLLLEVYSGALRYLDAGELSSSAQSVPAS